MSISSIVPRIEAPTPRSHPVQIVQEEVVGRCARHFECWDILTQCLQSYPVLYTGSVVSRLANSEEDTVSEEYKDSDLDVFYYGGSDSEFAKMVLDFMIVLAEENGRPASAGEETGRQWKARTRGGMLVDMVIDGQNIQFIHASHMNQYRRFKTLTAEDILAEFDMSHMAYGLDSKLEGVMTPQFSQYLETGVSLYTRRQGSVYRVEKELRRGHTIAIPITTVVDNTGAYGAYGEGPMNYGEGRTEEYGEGEAPPANRPSLYVIVRSEMNRDPQLNNIVRPYSSNPMWSFYMRTTFDILSILLGDTREISDVTTLFRYCHTIGRGINSIDLE